MHSFVHSSQVHPITNKQPDQSRHLLQRKIHDWTSLEGRGDEGWKPVGEDDGVAVVVEDVDHGVRLHKSSDLPQHKTPLQLVFRLISGRVFVWKKKYHQSQRGQPFICIGNISSIRNRFEENLTRTNLFWELSNQISNQLHLLQEQTDNNEPANFCSYIKLNSWMGKK